MQKILLACLAWLFASTALAQPEAWQWQMQPEQSSISWQATQNSAPITGKFSQFEAQIQFHPDALAQSKVIATIHTGSVATSYDEAQSTLTTADWLASEAFPSARFECTSFEKLADDKQFRCQGTLTLKGKMLPLALDFTLVQWSDHLAKINGEAILKRTAFAVGWDETAQVEDDVKVSLSLTASR